LRAIYVQALSLLLLIHVTAFGLQVSVNGGPERSLTSGELRSLSYPVTLPGNSDARGFSLDEILPLMSEIYRLEATSGERLLSFQDGSLAEKLTGIFLLSNGKQWDLLVGEQLISRVTAISIWGERLSDRELEVWVAWEGTDLLKEEIRRFAERHGLSIKTVEVPNTSSKLLAVHRGGGSLPDVVMIQSTDVSGLARAKALQSLDYLQAPNLADKGWDAFRWEEKLWAVPFNCDVQLLYYNPDIVELQGEAWTLQDLEAAAETVLKNSASGSREIVPMAWNVYSVYWFVAFQKGFGKVDIVEPDGGIIINDAPTKEALGYLLDLSKEGLFEPMERDAMISGFAMGKVGIILSGSYTIPHFMDLGIPFRVKAYPVHPQTGEPVAPFLDFKGFAVTRKTRHPVLARRLIQHMTGAGVQQRFGLSFFKMPARTDVWPVMEEGNPYFPEMAESYDMGIIVPTAPSYNIFKNTLWKILRFVFSEQMTIDEALTQGQAIINVQLAETIKEE
jgi:ABC-type glycerol-3-phosphate transport system substrate-binding protein